MYLAVHNIMLSYVITHLAKLHKLLPTANIHAIWQYLSTPPKLTFTKQFKTIQQNNSKKEMDRNYLAFTIDILHIFHII